MLGRTRDDQKETYARGQPLLAGETVVPGRYRCRKCDHEREVGEGRIVNLPVCPDCQHDTWELADSHT
jgi:Zn finger protein HypA/HybF involved in hydrogenase expression